MSTPNHPVFKNNPIFKIYQSNNNESFLYSILAALYSHKIDRRSFHHPKSYENYKKYLNLKNIQFPIKNKDVPRFFK